MEPDDRIVRIDEAERLSGLKRPTIYEHMRLGIFPQSFHLGTGRAKGWLLSDIRAWIRDHAARR